MPNNRPVRRGHLISPFGVGAMIDFRGDESLMTAGLDEWPWAREECPSDWLVTEERLQARLNVTHFRLPPDYRRPGRGIQLANQSIPFVRFPRWHYCPRRGAMEQLPLFGGRIKCPCRPGLDCESLPEFRRPYLIPSRFIAVCPKGHIEDFPFVDWLHRGSETDEIHRLRLLPGRSSASLSGITVRCSCGRSESMGGTFNFDAERGGPLHRIGRDCAGDMPWLGVVDGQPGQCGEHLRVVQRGATNVYFPLTVSSIYLPLWGENTARRTNEILETPNVWSTLTAGLDDGQHIQAVRCETVADIYQIDAVELMRAAQDKLDGSSIASGRRTLSEEDHRREEYEALRAGRGGDATRLSVDLRDSASYGRLLEEVWRQVGLVRKLRETRVLVGFTRLFPVEDAASSNLMPMSEGEDLRWLPASVVHGEGIFVEFNSRMLDKWADHPKVKERSLLLHDHFNRFRLQRGLRELEIGAKFILLHTFAHVLIDQLSFDCGYGSASIRERIYCEREDPDRPMQGVLIYTASGDSEGTLGGLVRQGEPDRLRATVDRAILRARWCSADPVCIDSLGQGSDNSNLAACHSCALLPETSCEMGNRLLDRGLLVGWPRALPLGLFGS